MRRGIVTHGSARTAVYRVWTSMKQRCLNPRCKAWPYYGGRGITVCERWLAFENFAADMGPRPAGYTLERRDNSRGYEPGNCEWAPRAKQQNNIRSNVYVEAFGERHTVREWEALKGFKRGTLYFRIFKYGWSPEQALTVPPAYGNRPRDRGEA